MTETSAVPASDMWTGVWAGRFALVAVVVGVFWSVVVRGLPVADMAGTGSRSSEQNITLKKKIDCRMLTHIKMIKEINKFHPKFQY